MSPKLQAMFEAELAKIDAMASRPVLTLVPVPLDLRRPVESYRTERRLPKHTMGPDDGSDEGPWITENRILTKTERGLSDRRVEDEQ